MPFGGGVASGAGSGACSGSGVAWAADAAGGVGEAARGGGGVLWQPQPRTGSASAATHQARAARERLAGACMSVSTTFQRGAATQVVLRHCGCEGQGC